MIDLFCGAGGGAMGFVAEDFKVVAAVEIDPAAARAYAANVGTHPLVRDVRRVTAPALLRAAGLAPGECTVLFGCPPCQSFTVLRRGRPEIDLDQVRNGLPGDWLRLVRGVRPRHVVFENVPGLVRGAGNAIFDALLRRLTSLGYKYVWDVIDAADHGVPQFRRRLLLVGSRVAEPRLPAPTHGDPESEAVRTGLRSRWLTVKDAIAHLPPPVGPTDHPPIPYHRARRHSAICVQRLLALKEGQSQTDLPEHLRLRCHREHDGHRDVYGRMRWKWPAPTLTSGCTNVTRGRFGHPGEPRAITLYEAMRLQTFPDGAVLEGTGDQMAAQVGNAVPTRLAERVAAVIADMEQECGRRTA
jgi:DNA (cytosine-5)-methyltransferase 1